MCRSRNQLLARVLFWLVEEILLNCLGFDNIADYSEFIFEKNHYPVNAQVIRWQGTLLN